MNKKLIIYSGHCEVVGGDVKYIVDILNNIDRSHFDITLYTDSRCHFYDWAENWLQFELKIKYLETMPYLFKPNLAERAFAFLSQSDILSKLLNIKIKKQPAAKYLVFIYKILSFYHLRLKIVNFLVFKKLFENESPDIFWFNNGGYPGKEGGLIALILAKFYFKVPKTIMTFHNVPAPKMKFKPSEILYDYYANKALDHIIAVSQILKTNLVEERNFDPEKIDVVYCGLDDRQILSLNEVEKYKLSLNIPSDLKVLILTGNLDELRKGHNLTLNALGILKKRFQNFIFLIIGQGTGERVKELEDLVITNNLSKNVKFLGQRYDIHELNCICDLALVPSFGAEATPYTIKEASRAGKPVITTNEGGCAEGIIPEITGVLLTENDPQFYSELIYKMLNANKAAAEMGLNSKKYFLEKFEMKKISEFYNSILKN